MILCISVLSVVISPFSFLILLIWFFSLCFLMSLANGLRRNSRIPPQLEKRHVVPPSSQDEALAPYSVSREVPRSFLKCETVLAPLMRPQKFLDTPVWLEENTEVPGTTKWRSRRRYRSIAVYSRQDRNACLDFRVKRCNEVMLYQLSTPNHSNNRWTIKIDPKRHAQICREDNIQATQRVDGGSHPGQNRGTAIGNVILVEEEKSTLCKRGSCVTTWNQGLTWVLSCVKGTWQICWQGL